MPLIKQIEKIRQSLEVRRQLLRDRFNWIVWGRHPTYLIGDSHCAAFGHIPGTTLFLVPGRSMYAVGRDKGVLFERRVKRMVARSPIIFVFGTRDVRIYIGYIADTRGRTRQAIIADLVEAYLSALSVKIPPDRPVIVASVLPGLRDDTSARAGIEVYGSQDDRVELGRALNRLLAVECGRRGFYFLDYWDVYATPDGFLREELSDGGRHVGDHAAALIDPKVREAIAWAQCRNGGPR